MNKLRLIELRITAGHIVTEISHETSMKVKHYHRNYAIDFHDRDEDIVYGVKKSIQEILEEINNEPSRD